MSNNHTSCLSANQLALIRSGVREKRDWESVWKEASGEKLLAQKLVREEMDKVAQNDAKISGAKREGTRLINEFLEKIKDGDEVEGMSALFEQAIYRDILRRYAELADPFASMSTEQILKLEMAYRSARAGKHKTDKNQKNEMEHLREVIGKRISKNGADDES